MLCASIDVPGAIISISILMSAPGAGLTVPGGNPESARRHVVPIVTTAAWSHSNRLQQGTRAAKRVEMQADPRHGDGAVSVAPSAEEILARLARMEFSAGSRVTEPSLDDTLPKSKLSDGRSLHSQTSLGLRALRRVSRFLLTVCIGVAATLAWQSYGDAAKETVADWVAQSELSSWLPLARLLSALDVPRRQATPPTPAPAPIIEPGKPEIAPGAPLLGMPQLEAMAQDFATIRQSVEQLAAGQEQLAQDMIKLQSAVQEIEQKTFAPALKPDAGSGPKPQATSPRPRRSAAPIQSTTP